MGRAGDQSVRTAPLFGYALNVVPVISDLQRADGTYNVNADHAAGAIAGALCPHAAFVTNAPGVRAGEAIAPTLSAPRQRSDRPGHYSRRHDPKVQAALAAVANGVRQAVITDLPGLAAGTGTVFVA